MRKKAQIGIKELLVTVVVAGLLAVVGLMVFSKVSNVSEEIFDKDQITTVNETVTISSVLDGDSNSTLLTYDDLVADTTKVVNATNDVLVENTDYSVADTTGNFTLLLVENSPYNNTAIYVSYAHYEESDAMASKGNIDTTVLDSFELAVIALIVLAATVILGTLFALGSK